jgi:hypothetical protein
MGKPANRQPEKPPTFTSIDLPSRGTGGEERILSHEMYLLISFRKSTPAQNRQLIVYYYLLKYQVDDFVGELTF